MTKRKIVANIVGRNEADNYLSRVLARVAEQVDMICFTDDASEDDTAVIAGKFGAHVNVMAEPTFAKHEGQLRQASWEFLESQITAGDEWFVLAIDCDEMLYETRIPLRELVSQNHTPVLGITFYHMWNENEFRIDKAWRPHTSSRLFRYQPGGHFVQRQLACGSEPTYVMEYVQQRMFDPDTGLAMKHLSYIKDEDKKAKYDRYMALDGGAFHANAHIQSIMDTDPQLYPWPWSGGGPE